MMNMMYWPGLNTLRSNSQLIIFFVIFFYLFYGSAAWLADFVPWRFNISFAWEKNIPFLPQTAIIYTSISGLMLLSLFVIRDKKELRHLLKILCLQTVIGALLFILVPISTIYPPRYTNEALPLAFLIADTLNLHNNRLPSLHVCFAFTTAAVLSHYACKWQTLLLYGWAVAIAVSAMTIHEHALLDLGSGMLLATWGVWYWRKLSHRTSTPPTRAPQFRVEGDADPG